MAGTEGRRAAVPCSTHEEERHLEQERSGARGKSPFLETCNIVSRRTKHSPQLLYRKIQGSSLLSRPAPPQWTV